jgi:DUF4097 and DUF4098 domain-containing protein YvlB
MTLGKTINQFAKTLFLLGAFVAVGFVASGEDKTARSVTVNPRAVINLCLGSGSITVRGEDQNTVGVRVAEEARIDFRQLGGNEAGASSVPATRLDVIISPAEESVALGECFADNDVDLTVPRGATVHLKTRDGDIEVTDVGEAMLETMSGNLIARRIARGLEASTLGGDISVSNAGGNVRLRAVSGNIEAADLRSTEAANEFEARTVSGDLSLEKIAQARVDANTVSGDITMDFSPGRTGRYNVKTTSGDITLAMPGNASFQISARVKRGDLINDFDLKQTAGAARNENHLEGSVGSGDATITIYSFSGSIQLRRK